MKRLACALAAALSLAAAGEARAQMPGGGAPGGGQGGGPTQSAPTRNRTVGPQRGPGDEDQGPSPSSRPMAAEPTAQAPADPLALPDGIQTRIGTDYAGGPPSPEGQLHLKLFPYFEERRGDYRLRLLPPLWLEHTRGLDPKTGATTPHTDRQSLFAMLFYQRRSPRFDADVLFPLAWRVRDRENHVLVLGPLAHREAPKEHDNWLAPLLFEGKRANGGYFHALPLLTTSHWDDKGAFTIVGPYFRDRKESDVDLGVVPFFFHGDNGDENGARATYTLIPPALYYHSTHELDESALTVVGPIISHTDPKRSVFDVAPLFFSIQGKPETGGVKESHVTLFPLFHYGKSPEQSLFVLPGYLRRVTATTDTLITPFFSHATTRNRATSMTIAGPILPVYYHATDVDVGYKALGIFPFYYHSSDPTGNAFATPLFARFENYNVSRTYWAFPSIVYQRDLEGWSVDVHPLAYVGRSGKSTHTVLAPVFWDFASPEGRTTIGFPIYWRFADTKTSSVTQIAANTLYKQKRVVGGLDWQFHLLPIFSYGAHPRGSWWNVLFGLIGYDHDGPTTKIKALWLPITVSGGGAASNVAGR